MEVIKVFNYQSESYKSYESSILNYRNLSLTWYKVCWPWIALYMSLLPNMLLFALPAGTIMVMSGGASLSGGEAQRISIARCILKDSPIVILDEATASVDADNEAYIQEAIDELCLGKTLLVIAHRLNTIKNADAVFKVENRTVA